jgi:hypothetical protein
MAFFKMTLLLLLLFLTLPKGQVYAEEPERITVTATRIWPDRITPFVRGDRRKLCALAWCGKGPPEPSDVSWTFSGKRGCQECQSETALYNCSVEVHTPIDELADETLNSLRKENCCKANGGRVLNTIPGRCR